MSETITLRDPEYGWADVTPTVHEVDPVKALALKVWRLRDDELEAGDMSRHECLCDMATALEMIVEYDEGCECKPDGELCYVCRKVAEATRILGE